MKNTPYLNLSVKKISNFLNKWGFALRISKAPCSKQSTYCIVDLDNQKEEVFVGNYKHFLKFLASLAIIYNKMLEQAVLEELEESSKIKGGAA